SEPPRPTSYCPVFLAERQLAEDAEFGIESPEEAAERAADKAESEKALAQFDQEMEAAEKEIAEAEALAEEHLAQDKARTLASGIDRALLERKLVSGSASEATRAAIQDLQATHPEQAAELQKELAQTEQLETEFADMEKESAADFPPDPTREDILAAIARHE